MLHFGGQWLEVSSSQRAIIVYPMHTSLGSAAGRNLTNTAITSASRFPAHNRKTDQSRKTTVNMLRYVTRDERFETTGSVTAGAQQKTPVIDVERTIEFWSKFWVWYFC